MEINCAHLVSSFSLFSSCFSFTSVSFTSVCFSLLFFSKDCRTSPNVLALFATLTKLDADRNDKRRTKFSRIDNDFALPRMLSSIAEIDATLYAEVCRIKSVNKCELEKRRTRLLFSFLLSDYTELFATLRVSFNKGTSLLFSSLRLRRLLHLLVLKDS